MHILDLLGMYFDAAVVFVTNSQLLFRFTLAILWVWLVTAPGYRGDGELMFNSIIVLLASLTMSVLSLQCAPIEVRALGCTARHGMAQLRGSNNPFPFHLLSSSS